MSNFMELLSRATAEYTRVLNENETLKARIRELEERERNLNTRGVMIGIATYPAIRGLTSTDLRRLDQGLNEAKTAVLSVRNFDTRENNWPIAMRRIQTLFRELSIEPQDIRLSTGDGYPDFDQYMDTSRSERQRIMGCIGWLKARARHHKQGSAVYDGAMYLETLLGLCEHRGLV